MTVTISRRAAVILGIALVLVIPGVAGATHIFTDVVDGSTHAAGIEWVANAGVSAGCQDGTKYCPNDFVTRAQMGTFMCRLSGNCGVAPSVDAATAIDSDTLDTLDSSDFALAADTYSRAEADAAFVPHGEIVLRHSTSELTPHTSGGPTTITYFVGGNIVSGDGAVNINLVGPAVLGGVDYGLKSVEYCIVGVGGGAFVDFIEAASNTPVSIVGSDSTNRTADGCYAFDVNDSAAQAYDLWMGFGGGGSLRVSGVQTTWAPASTLPGPNRPVSGSGGTG